jgi:hypothetical protein
MGTGNEFFMVDNLIDNPRYISSGVNPDEYYALPSSSPAWHTATDGTNIGAWQDQPTAISLNDFSAVQQPDWVLVQWETAQESDLVGFNLFRASSLDSERLLLNSELIQNTAPGSPIGASYSYADKTAITGITYYYWLEVVTSSGEDIFGPIREIQSLFIYLPLMSR